MAFKSLHVTFCKLKLRELTVPKCVCACACACVFVFLSVCCCAAPRRSPPTAADLLIVMITMIITIIITYSKRVKGFNLGERATPLRAAQVVNTISC